MEMNGSHLIPADRQTVWEALNNPDVLRASIPGCKELDMSAIHIKLVIAKLAF